MFKFKEIFVCVICLSLIPFSLGLWIYNKAQANMYSGEIKDVTLYEYVSSEVLEKYSGDVSKLSEIESKVLDSLPQLKVVEVTMNFAGDCTLGTDPSFGYSNTFTDVFAAEKRYDYFFENMQELFANDDVTVVNLEGPFTDSTNRVVKKFNFKGPAEYANILISGNIDAVNLANNHTMDFGQKGYEDTLNTLNDYNIPYFGYDNYYIYEKDGVKIGFAGLTSIGDGTIYKRIDNAMVYFDENDCDSKIFTFHWGIEREYCQNGNQQKVGRYVIDKGADLVVGHHSHVLQGIEKYKGRYIVYSLANFCFGGNTNPPDKDTMVFNYKLKFENHKPKDIVATVYPARVSSVNNRNDYKPTLASGDERTRIMNKILKYSNIKVDDNGIVIND